MSAKENLLLGIPPLAGLKKFNFPYMDSIDENLERGERSNASRPAAAHVTPPVARIPTRAALPTVTHLVKRPAVDIDFRDISYTSSGTFTWPSASEKKKILHGVSGSFCAGELTAIMGPSGAGKTTLLNILAGYLKSGVTGAVETNGHPRQEKYYRKLISYIMQEEALQPFLTVLESMTFAANFKLGNELTQQQKAQAVDEVLETLGLTSCRNTRTEQLSGGQKKRLSVAQELASNPPVIFLDEPTTGLDVVTTFQVVEMLQKLARQGRTIICTIHQPSATVFQLFDLVYVMGNGCCVYQGSQRGLVPFLASAGFQCPKNHSPVDYILEVITLEEQQKVSRLSNDILNGKIRFSYKRKRGNTKLARQETIDVMPLVFNTKEAKTRNPSLLKSLYDPVYPTSFTQQVTILLRRKFLQQSRDKTTFWILFCHHVACAGLIGTIFIGVGNDANRPFDNFKFIIANTVFFMYTHMMCNVLLFPFEVKKFRREHLNRWYGLKSYFTALTIATLPQQTILGSIFVVLEYYLTNQPLEWTRFLWFWFLSILTGFTSEGLGLLIGSMFSVMNGCIAGPATVVPFLVLAGHGIGSGVVVGPFMHFVMNLSYLRNGVVGLSVALYGDERPYMNCTEDYCHYRNPGVLLKDLGMGDSSLLVQGLALFSFSILFRVIAFVALRVRTKQSLGENFKSFVLKILRFRL